MSPEVPLLYRVVFVILSFVVFPYEVEYYSLEVCKKLCCDFDGQCIESVDCFW